MEVWIVRNCQFVPATVKLGNEDWRLRHEREPDDFDGIELSSLSEEQRVQVFALRAMKVMFGQPATAQKDSDDEIYFITYES